MSQSEYQRFLTNVEQDTLLPERLKSQTDIKWDLFWHSDPEGCMEANGVMNLYSCRIIHTSLLWIAEGFSRDEVSSHASTGYYDLVHKPFRELGGFDSEPVWQSKDLIVKFINPEWS